MDEDDFFEDLDLDSNDEPDPDGPPPEPSFRAVVADGRVSLITWMPWLADGVATRPAFEARAAAGVTIADVTVFGSDPNREVIVDYLAHGGGRSAERALERWAELSGYLRIWFPARVETFDECPPLRTATVTCPSCGHAYREREAGFWVGVRQRGHFPNWCLLCGGDLPQWKANHR
jgi:hypothetical protein